MINYNHCTWRLRTKTTPFLVLALSSLIVLCITGCQELSISENTDIPTIGRASNKIDYSFRFIGDDVNKVRQDIDNWVYGKNHVVLAMGYNPFTKPDVFLDFKTLPKDEFYVISPHANSIFVVRDNLIIAEVVIAKTNTYVYDVIPQVFQAVQPLEVSTEQSKYPGLHGLNNYLFSELSWSSTNANIQMLVGAREVNHRSDMPIIKRNVFFYVIQWNGIKN